MRIKALIHPLIFHQSAQYTAKIQQKNSTNVFCPSSLNLNLSAVKSVLSLSVQKSETKSAVSLKTHRFKKKTDCCVEWGGV